MKTLRTSTPRAFSIFRLSAFPLCLLLSAFSLQVFSLLCAAQSPSATATITGRVYNTVTGFYLKNAEVRVEGNNNIVYTEDGGVYTITVPAGPVTLTASYASVQTATITINAAPDTTNTADFELQPLLIGRPAPLIPAPGTATGATPATESDVVMLDRFIVTDERSGQAKAIMTQRAADNAVTAIATDNFGELTQGAVGEFLKYMPGVTIDYGEDEAESVRVGGLDPKYVGFSLDGISLASANINSDTVGSRANLFEQMSITGIESIEFNQTLLARMPASTPAGTFEMKSKYAFDRKRPQLRYTLGLDGVSDAIELGRSYMPDDKKHYRTYPGGQISYGGPFFGRRLGLDMSVSRFASYRNNQHHRIVYAYLNPDPVQNPTAIFVEKNGNLEMVEGPTIRQLQWRDGPQIRTYYAASLSIDYKVTPNLTFSMRNQFSYSEREYFNIYINLTGYERDDTENRYGPFQGIHPRSTLTHWIVDPAVPNSPNSSIYEGNSYRTKITTNYLLSPRFEYKKGPLQINFRAGHSYSHVKYHDAEDNRFRGSNNRIGGIGWKATRSDTSSPAWTLTQTQSGGADWSEPQNWARVGTYGTGIYYNSPFYTRDILNSAFIDLIYAIRVLGQPLTLRTGAGITDNDYTFRKAENRFNFTGPDGSQLRSPIPYTQNYIFNIDLGGKAGNINEQGWRVDDQGALWAIYQQNKEWFYEDTLNNFRRNFINARDLTETISAAYIEATTRVGRFSFNAGLRFESTATEVMTIRMRPWEEINEARKNATPEQIATGMFDYVLDSDGIGEMSTNEGFRYRYYDGKRFPRNHDYNNLFLSGGLKYDITKNFRLQLSVSQAILRPDRENLAGTMSYNVYYTDSVWVPNPTLKPEETIKIYAGLQYYFTAASHISISAFRLDIDGLQVPNIIISADQASAQLGYPMRGSTISGGDDEDGGDGDGGTGSAPKNEFYYRSTINAPGTRTVYGLTLEYNQQFTFLPGALKGLSAFGSFTTSSLRNAQMEEEKIGRANKSASGGLRWRYGRVNLQIRASWQDDSLYSITRPLAHRAWFSDDHIYRKARTIVDLSGGLKLTRNTELSFSIRNLTDSPAIFYSNVPDRLYQYQVFGSVWNLSLKGTF